jgi:D-arabinose 5-phosphate isomerase GutQ
MTKVDAGPDSGVNFIVAITSDSSAGRLAAFGFDVEASASAVPPTSAATVSTITSFALRLVLMAAKILALTVESSARCLTSIATARSETLK